MSHNKFFCISTSLYNGHSSNFCITWSQTHFLLAFGCTVGTNVSCLHYIYPECVYVSLFGCMHLPLAIQSNLLDSHQKFMFFYKYNAKKNFLWHCCIRHHWIAMHSQNVGRLLMSIHHMFVNTQQYKAPHRRMLGGKSLNVGAHAFWEELPTCQYITQRKEHFTKNLQYTESAKTKQRHKVMHKNCVF